MKKHILLIALLSCMAGCASVPFDFEFNKVLLKKREEKLVLGKPVDTVTRQSDDEAMRLRLSKHPNITWKKSF